MPPNNIEADVEVRNRVPHGSASHSGHAEIRIAVRYVPETGAKRNSTCQSATDQRRRSTVVLYTKHAAIDRRSPLRIPSMLIGGVERPYSGEFYIGAGGVYALSQPSQSCIQAAAKHRSRSPGGGRVACSAFRIDRLSGDRIARQAKWVIDQEGRRRSPAELVARMTGSLGCPVISTAGIMQCCRRAHEAPRLVEAKVEHGIEELLPLVVEDVVANRKWSRRHDSRHSPYDPHCVRPSKAKIHRGPATAGIALAVVFKRDAPRQAAAELPRVSGADDAVGRSVGGKPPSRKRIGSLEVQVEERPHAARREAGKLEEPARVTEG